MNTGRFLACSLAALSLVLFTLCAIDEARAFDEGYGSVTGQFVLAGKVPKPELQRRKGDPNVKDASCCAAKDHYNDRLVIDEKTKGIANIFIYMRKAKKVHPNLVRSKVKEVTFDQKGCTFEPHSLLVRTDQAVRVVSSDPTSHNVHTFPIRGQAVNFLLKPNDREGIALTSKVPEILPIQVKCDIHPWMSANWLILDHPYAAITDKQGKFRIDLLPAGEHEFRVWHEKVGYINRKFKVTIKAGGTTELAPVKVPVARFED